MAASVLIHVAMTHAQTTGSGVLPQWKAGNASTTYIVPRVSSTSVQIPSLGSAGSPCLSVNASGTISTSTCGTAGALTGSGTSTQIAFFTSSSSLSSSASTTIVSSTAAITSRGTFLQTGHSYFGSGITGNTDPIGSRIVFVGEKTSDADLPITGIYISPALNNDFGVNQGGGAAATFDSFQTSILFVDGSSNPDCTDGGGGGLECTVIGTRVQMGGAMAGATPLVGTFKMIGLDISNLNPTFVAGSPGASEHIGVNIGTIRQNSAQATRTIGLKSVVTGNATTIWDGMFGTNGTQINGVGKLIIGGTATQKSGNYLQTGSAVGTNQASSTIEFGTNDTDRMVLASTTLRGATHNAMDLGSASVRWRDIYSATGIYASGTLNVTGVSSLQDMTFTNATGTHLVVSPTTSFPLDAGSQFVVAQEGDQASQRFIGSGGGGGLFEFYNSDGTLTAPTTSTDENSIGIMDFKGYIGGAFTSAGQILGELEEPYASTSWDGRFVFAPSYHGGQDNVLEVRGTGVTVATGTLTVNQTSTLGTIVFTASSSVRQSLGVSYSIFAPQGSNNPASNTTYYFPDQQGTLQTIDDQRIGFLIPVSGTLTDVYVMTNVGGTLASSTTPLNATSTFTVNLNGVGTSVVWGEAWMSLNPTAIHVTSSIAVTAGQRLSIKVQTPAAWTVSPTTVRQKYTFYFTEN